MEMNKKYQALFENSITALFITRTDGTILEVNQAACRMFGYSEEEFRRLGTYGFLDPNSPGLVEKLKERKKAGSTSGEVIGVRKNGERFWCEFSSTVFDDPDGGRIASMVLIDMFNNTDRQESLKGVMNNVPGVIYRYVTEADRVEETQFVSGGVKQVLGFNPDEIFENASLGWKHIHEDDVERVIQSMKESAKKNTKWASEYRYHHPDGTLRWLRGMGNPVSNKDGRVVWDSIVIDITEEKQAGVYIKLMESVASEANDAVLITKAEPVEEPDGPEIIYVNRGFEEMTGYKAEEVIGKTPRILQGPYTSSKELQKLREAVRNREGIEVELLNYSKQGEEYWVNISLSPVFENGKCTHFISIQKDITERKLRELQSTLSSEISQIFNREKKVKKALQYSLDQIADLKLFDALEFWLVDREQMYMNLAAFTISNPEIGNFYPETKVLENLKKGEGLPGKTWERKKNLFWRNLETQKNFIRREKAGIAGLKTAFSFPIMDSDKVLGVILLMLSDDLKKERYYVDLFKMLSVQFASEIMRKQLEEELYRIFTFAPDGIIVAGFDGYLKKVNPALCGMLEYSEEELLATPFLEFVHPNDREKTLQEYENANRGFGKSYFENRYVKKSGKVIWLSWTFKIFKEEEIAYSVAKDITEQKELEELLEQANRLAKIGSWEVDLTNNKVYWSNITRQIHEEEPAIEPALETSINYYKKGEPRKRIQRAVDEAMKNGSPWDLELPIITGKGNERWVRVIGEAELENGKPIRLYGSFQDIHEQKLAELNLLERTRHINTIARLNSALLNFENWYEALESHLAEIGEAVQSDRVYYFENRFNTKTGEGFATQKLEWSREGIESQLNNPDLEEMPFGKAPELFDPMLDGKPSMLLLRDIEEGTLLRTVMENQSIKSFLTIPVYVQDIFYGFVGFDNCTEEVIWSEEEIRTLNTITSNLAVAIEREKTEIERRKLFEERNEILESIGDAFFAVDHNWIVTYWNNVAENVLSMPRNEIIGKNLWDLYKDATILDFYTEYHKAVREQVNVHFEEYYPAIDKWFEVSAYPSSSGLSVYFKDITDRKRSREMILEKTRQLDAIAQFNFLLIKENNWQRALDKSLELFGEVANADRVYFFEHAVLETTGQDVISMKVEWVSEGTTREIDNPNHHNHPFDDIRSFIDQVIHDGGFNEVVSNIKDKEFAEFIADQEIKSILALPVFTGKEFRGFIGFDDCTSERVWTEEEITFLKTIAINLGSAIENEDAEKALKQLNSTLEQQAKELVVSNAELEQFAFVASHDLQEPLRMITSFLAQLEKKYDHLLDEKGKKYIYFATDGAKRMRQIIMDLLEYSRVGRIDADKSQVDLNVVLEDAASLNRKMIQDKKADVSWEKMPVIYTSKTQMQQLFQNLMNNAVNYQEPGNKPVVKIHAEETENEWIFSVQDNGIGIAPEYSEKIFNIFQRLHGREEYSGTGVGLAICKKIVGDQGGKIWVESEPGKGSTFYFTIAKIQNPTDYSG